MKKIIERLIREGISKPHQIKGCSRKEIKILSLKAPGTLPYDYVAFLEEMGKSAGTFMRDIDIFYDSLGEARKQADFILEDEPLVLPDKAFVFAARLYEQFMFFDLSNPPSISTVYYYREDDADFQVAYPSFSSFVQDELKARLH